MRVRPFGVGSLPWNEPRRAVGHVLRHYQDAPFVPQLPLRGTLSQMVTEPFQRYRNHFDSSRGGTIRKGAMEALVALSELSPSNRLDAAPRSGVVDFDECLDLLRDSELPRCKVQLIGPGTLFKHLLYGGRTVPLSSKEGRALFALYLEEVEYRLASVRLVAPEVTFVLDEPALPYLGRDELSTALPQLERLGAIIRERGAAFGIHCCGSIDDPGVHLALTSLQADLLSTPWLRDTGTAAGVELRSMVKAGGTLALGVCPTDASIAHFDPVAIAGMLHRFEAGILEAGEVQLAVSASCGLAFTDEASAEAVGRAISRLCELFST